MDAPNVHPVLDLLWSSGQLSRDDILELPDLGIDTVINLALPTSSNALPGEAELVTSLGLTYLQIPVEWERPEPEQFARFVGLLQACAGQRLWVHCAKNMRVSVFVYLYRRLVRGEDEAQAAFPMREVWKPNPIWQIFIDTVLATWPQEHGPATARTGR